MLKRLALKVRNLIIGLVLGIFSVLGIQSVLADDNNLSWQHDGISVEGFYVYHKLDNNAYTRIATLTNSGARAYLHADQAAGTHCYQVSAYNATGESDLSNEACKTILSVPFPPFGLSVN